MKPSRLLIPIVGAAALLVGCQSKDPFAIADTDNNGTISQAEFERFMLEAIFTASDADGDGKVTAAEYAAANPAGKKFAEVDGNNDGSVTPGEAKMFSAKQGTMAELFKKIDTDGDGQLTRNETETFYTQVHESEGSTNLEKLSNAAQ